MCGIAGIVFSSPDRLVDPSVLDAPLSAIVHRGPDGEGRLVRPGFAAGMRRLAIIDLAGGDQPIFNEDGTVGVLFNGEIYNYRELRDLCRARGHRFRTDSDTETLVHLYEELGDEMLERLDGMFGFVIWDAKRKRALLARDRFGIKPLYLCRTPDGLAFASEIKAFAAMGVTRPAIAASALGDYVRYLWYPEPKTAWEGVERLPPATSVVVERGLASAPRRYYTPVIRPRRDRSEPEVLEEIASLTRAAVKRQLVADVPVGAFLSGGLDSTWIVAEAVGLGATVPAHTIRIAQDDSRLDPMDDDAAFAGDVARELGIAHHVHDAHPRIVDLLPRLLSFTDDPIADPAIIHAFLICDAARKESKVLLSGMGADEVAGGYRRHVAAAYLHPFYWLPERARTSIRGLSTAFAAAAGFPGVSRLPALRRLTKLATSTPPDLRALPASLASWTPEPWITRLGLTPTTPSAILDRCARRVDADWDDALSATMGFDVGMYLPSHNLRYMDKMSMAASVEVRVPYLDNALAERLMSLPPSLHVSRGVGKVAMRRAARGRIPDAILTRPKTGFAAPIRSWLHGPLRPMLHDLLAEDRVRRRGLVTPSAVAAMIRAHERGGEDLSYPLWALLTLELWCEQAIDRPRFEGESCFRSSSPSVTAGST